METPENVIDEDGSDEVWEHPWASGLESSSCFLPSTGVDPCNELIQLFPSLCGGSFLVIGGGRMIGCGGRQMRELQIDQKGLGQRAGRTATGSTWAGPNGPADPGPFWDGSGPSSSPRLILAFWT
jgi:hypothetical protein